MQLAHREYYWHVHNHWIMYILMIVSFAVFGYGAFRKIMLWSEMKPAGERFTDIFRRAWKMIVDVLFQGRVRKKMLPGVFHSMIFWSFLVLMMTTAILTVEIDVANTVFKASFFRGNIYLAVSFFADIAGAFLIVGLAIAVVRRYVLKPKTLPSDWQNAYMLLLLLFLGFGGFVLEGLRIRFAGDPWAIYSPVGLAFSKALAIPANSVPYIYPVIWWSHACATFILIASLPYTKFVHFILIPANYMFSNMKPKGTLGREDLEELFARDDADEFRIGHTDASDLTWKNAMDLDACVECGRCEEICPAAQCGYPLVPRDVIQSLKKSLYKMYDAKEKAGANGGAGKKEGEPVQVMELAPFVGDTIKEETIWLCRTCRACMEVCPAMIEHVDQIIDLRRAQVMMAGELPTDAKNALKAIETRGNPFGPRQGRLGWIKGEKPDILAEVGETDVLFWLGCVANFDQSKQHIANNMFAIMRHCGIRFAMLGDEETCCGDPARSLGDENVFQAVARAQNEVLKQYKFNKIVTICPHCRNSLKNEFRQFGGNYEVVHHTEFLMDLIKRGKVELNEKAAGKVTYHDPCYLGRYADVFKDPRRIVKSIDGLEFVEAKNSGGTSFCCGAGGGNYYMDMDLDVPGDERLNVRRAKELVNTGADTIAVACPYCMQMLDDALKLIEMDEKVKIKDISTFVIEAMGIKPAAAPAPAEVEVETKKSEGAKAE